MILITWTHFYDEFLIVACICCLVVVRPILIKKGYHSNRCVNYHLQCFPIKLLVLMSLTLRVVFEVFVIYVYKVIVFDVLKSYYHNA